VGALHPAARVLDRHQRSVAEADGVRTPLHAHGVPAPRRIGIRQRDPRPQQPRRDSAGPSLALHDFEGSGCHLAVNVASKTDLAALAILFPTRANDGQLTRAVFVRCYLNDAAMMEVGTRVIRAGRRMAMLRLRSETRRTLRSSRRTFWTCAGASRSPQSPTIPGALHSLRNVCRLREHP
jgi:hypothetical protein